MKISICFASDDRYAEHLGVAVTSILHSRGCEDEFAFYILDGGISEENKKKILSLEAAEKTKITFVPAADSLFEGLPDPSPLWSIAIYYRLAAPQLIPGEERLLYLDGDVAVRRSLAPLWQTDLGDCCAAGVADIAAPTHIARLRRAGFELARYVNTGVLLLDLKKWREEGLTGRFFQFISAHRNQLSYPDQDALNIILQERILPLDPQWNTQTSGEPVERTELFQQAADRAAVIHFLGTKPWRLECRNPFQSVYEEYWALSPWKKAFRRFQRQRNKIMRRDRRRKLFRIRLLGREKWIILFGKTFYHRPAG